MKLSEFVFSPLLPKKKSVENKLLFPTSPRCSLVLSLKSYWSLPSSVKSSQISQNPEHHLDLLVSTFYAVLQPFVHGLASPANATVSVKSGSPADEM